MKKVNDKRLHIVGFHLHYILEMTKFRDGKQISVARGLPGEVAVSIKG